MKKLAFAILLALSGPALGITVDPLIEPTTTLNCDSPIERTDGTPLALGEITELKFYSGTVSGTYTTIESNTVCSLVVDNTVKTDGDYYYVVTALDRLNRESTFSPEKIYTVQRVKPPKAPTWQ